MCKASIKNIIRVSLFWKARVLIQWQASEKEANEDSNNRSIFFILWPAKWLIFLLISAVYNHLFSFISFEQLWETMCKGKFQEREMQYFQ